MNEYVYKIMWRIRYLIDKKGLTLGQVAKMIGVNPATFSTWLRTTRPIPFEKVCELAQLLGVTMEELVKE